MGRRSNKKNVKKNTIGNGRKGGIYEDDYGSGAIDDDDDDDLGSGSIAEDSFGSGGIGDEDSLGLNDATADRKREADSEDSPLPKRQKHGREKILPSLHELNLIKETEALHHSNMFRMQMEELLKEIMVKEKYKVKLAKWIEAFSSFVKCLDTSKQFQLQNSNWIKEQNLTVPLHYSLWPQITGVFQFMPPDQIMLIGSFASHLATTHTGAIDLALILPHKFMQHNDLRNCRWLMRRVMYLSWLGNAVQSNADFVADVSWTYHCGSHLRPILQVTPTGKLGAKWKINLFPVPPQDFFRFSQISPLRNGVTLSWFHGRDKQPGDPVHLTPSYNWACGADVVMLDHNKLILETLSHSSWQEGTKLLVLWLRQRHLNVGEGCFTSHVMTLLVIHLIKTRKIILQMSPYQVFRTTLLYLSECDWERNGPSLANKAKSQNREDIIFTPQDFHQFYQLVFIGPCGYLNLVAHTFLLTFMEVKHEARKALEILNLLPSSSFEPLFIHKVEFHFNFDQILKIDLDDELISKIFSDRVIDKDKALLDSVGDKRIQVFHVIIAVLKKALSDRLDFMGMIRKASPTWKFQEDVPPLRKSLILGFLLNPVAALSLLTKGPSADTEEANNFREFWGDVSSLRRFQDSTFHEAVLWGEPTDPVADRRVIIGKIVIYILKNHFNLSSSDITYVASQLENFLKLPNYHLDFKYGTGEEATSLVVLAYDRLAKKLRGLDLPIKVTSIQSSSEVIKHSLVFPPLPRSTFRKEQEGTDYLLLEETNAGCPIYRYAIDVQLFLEISGKWPDDLVAIQAIKTEFHCKMAELLKNEGVTAIVFPKYLQILWEGYIFNLKVCYRREIYLRRIVNEGSSKGGDNIQEETTGSIDLEKEIEILPNLTSSLNNIQSEHQSFSGSVRLIRRWASSQLLMPHLPPTALELLTAHLFLSPAPYKAPNSPNVALLRFLNLMATTDWKTSPIIVNLRNQLSADDQNEIMRRFVNSRDSYPPLFICSPCELRQLATDASGASEPELRKRFRLLSFYTKQSPSMTILDRIKVVSASALECYTRNMYSRTVDFSVLFRPPIDDYDVVIHVKRLNLARKTEALYPCKPVSFKPYKHIDGERMPPVMFDPVQYYLRDLRAAYDALALFFHDEFGGDVIGVVWKPKALEPRLAKISAIRGHRIFGENQISNIEAFVEDFRILGEGLVEEIKITTSSK